MLDSERMRSMLNFMDGITISNSDLSPDFGPEMS